MGFSGPLDRKSAEDDQNWTGEWSEPSAKGAVPAKGKQELPIEAVRLSADGKTVMVTLEEVRPVANVSLQYRLRAADGAPVNGQLHGTVHRVPR